MALYNNKLDLENINFQLLLYNSENSFLWTRLHFSDNNKEYITVNIDNLRCVNNAKVTDVNKIEIRGRKI